MIDGMMGGDKKKGLAALIVGAGPKVKEVDETQVPLENVGLEAAADDLIEAMKSGNSKGVVEALKSFLDLCKDEAPAVEESVEE